MLGVAQLLGVALLLLLFRFAWSPALFSGRHLFEAWMPMLIWLGPFAIYAAARLRDRTAPKARSVRLILSALAGNFALLIGYSYALSALDQWQRGRFLAYAERCMREHLAEACPAGYPIFDPPPPPQYWQWALAAYAAALVALYLLLYAAERRLGRQPAGPA